ncbi:MAG: TadE/TadG family type IV pilus assembly protein [Patescibacteria group bacterium]|nr:TadE/TadG family type IV pilus assembly protein [Patescibacteria group bacterium]
MATLEMILVLPILLIVLVVSVQFGVLTLYQAAVTHATTVAVREAGKGADLDEVVEIVQAVVRDHGVIVSDAPSGTRIVLDGGSMAAPISYGDDSLACPVPAPATGFDEIRVTACVDLSATRFRDMLAPWGLTFAGRTFRASSLVTMELDQDSSTP